MPRKSLKKLAGYIAIELLCAYSAVAADYYYKAGFATYGHVEALALEDRRGHRAVIADATFSVPLSVADMVAAQVMKDYKIERSDLMIYSVATGDPSPAEALTAIGAALGKLNQAYLVYGNGRLTASSYDGKCLVGISPEGSLDACSTPAGDTVGGYIKSALTIVDLSQGLQTRDQPPKPSVAVQALAIGPVVLFSGPENVAQPGKRIILATTPAVENDTRLDVAAGEVFLRIGGRPH